MQMQVKLENRLMKTLRLDQIQSLEILQMSSLELEQYLIEKANENPLLTLDSENNSFQKLLETSYIKEKMSPSFSSEENHWDFIERSARVQENFEQFFIEQIPLAVPLSDLDVKILKFLICSLDDRLFLDVELAEVAEKFHTTSAHVEENIQLLQTLEPVGVGARNYIEYLLIQTNRFPNVPPFIKEIIKNDLHLVAENKLKQVAKKYSESLSEIQQVVAFIKNLKPIPAGFKETAIHYIVPDIEVYRAGGE